MAMNSHIIKREIIKPFFPTPENLRCYKISLLDQAAADMYVSILLFYPKPSQFVLDHLKESLSKTLSHFYHFAGRYKDICTLECNDSGVDFLSTLVNQNIDELIQHPKVDYLKQLIPYELGTSIASQSSPCDQPLLGIQVNQFSCGGICIASCIHHFLADASSISSFLNVWARINRGEDDDKENLAKDFTIMETCSIFNPIDVQDFPKSAIDMKAILNPVGTRVKRFIFDNPEIKSLVKSATQDNQQYPTRMEALCSFLWCAVIEAKIQRNNAIKKHVFYPAVNMRKKMIPPLPDSIIGNICGSLGALAEVKDCSIDFMFLLPKVQRSFRMTHDEFVEKTTDGIKFIKKAQDGMKYVVGINNMSKIVILQNCEIQEVGLFALSSWCRFPFYEIDFSWGKPNYVCTTSTVRNCANLMDTKDYSGIEATLSLEEEEMELLEENKEFLAYVSLNQSL